MTDPVTPPPETESLDRVQILAAMGITAIVLLIIGRIWLLFSPLGLLPVKITAIAISQGIIIGFGITLLSSIVYFLWPAYRSSANYYLNLILRPLAWPDLLWLGLLPGISEEFLFRGVMLPALGLDLWALLFSSLCFGVLHFSGSHKWSYVIWASIIGGILGFSALKTGNLMVPIAAHITTNLVSSLVWKVNRLTER